MEDLVAVAVELDNGEERFFMAWGRIQDTVDPEPLEQLVFSHCTGYSLGGRAVLGTFVQDSARSCPCSPLL